MNRTIQECSDALVAALSEVPELNASVIDGRTANPPQAIVNPPTMEWNSFCGGPNLLTFKVTLIAKADALSAERLYKFIPLIAAAVNGVEDALVVSAAPGTYGGTGDGFPAYNIDIEMSP